jgi:SHS2 domain-containing protein
VSFELRDHTADVAVAARGETLDETFAAVADGMAAAMCESVPETGERHRIAVHAESREALLFDYLDELIYRRDVDGVRPVANEASVDVGEEGVVAGAFRGVPLSVVTAREVKAVTYSEMRVERTDHGFTAYVVFDV